MDLSEIELNDGNKLNIPNTRFKFRKYKGWNHYYFDSGIRNNRIDTSSFGIYYSEQTSGHLLNKFTLLVNNHGYRVSLKNHFSFKKTPF